MPTFDQIRQMYPDAANASDSDIIQRYAQITGTDVKTAASDFGVQINDPGLVPTLKRSAAQMLGGVGEIYGDATGNHKNALSNYAQDVEMRNPSGINSFQDIANHPGLALAEATANGLTFLVPAKGLQLAGQGLKAAKYLNAARAVDNPVSQAALAGLPSLAGIGEDQRASGQGENLLMKYGGAGVVGAIENLGGIQRLAGINRAAPGIQETVNSFGKTPWRTVGKTVGRSMLEEGAEELAQNPIEQWAGYKDPTTSQNLYETALGGAMGALGGLGFGAYHGGRSGMQHSAIRRDIATDLLNTEQSFGRQQNLAQWESAFRNKAGEDGQQWYGDFMNTQNDARLANTTTWNEPLAAYQQRVAEAGNPFMGEGPTADFVNSQLGIGQKPVQQHYASAYNQRLPEPVIVPDSNGNPITISTVGEAYDYQHGMGKFAPQQAKVDALGYPVSQYQPVEATQTQAAAPSWEQFAVNPAAQAGTQQATTPAAQGVKQTTPRGAASQAFETKLNTAISEGKLAQDDPIIADWHASKKLKADAVSFGQALDDKLAGPNVMPATAEQALQQKAANAVAEVKGGALNLTMKQIPVFDHVQKAFAENRIDDVIGADGKWKYTEIGKALGIERGQVMSRVDGMANKLAASQGISVEEMKAALRARTAEVRTTEMSEADKLGLSPKQQSSVFNEEDLFGNENGAEQNAEVINSVGGSQSEIGTSEAPTDLVLNRPDAPEVVANREKSTNETAVLTAMVAEARDIAGKYAEEAQSTWNEYAESSKPNGSPFSAIPLKLQLAWLQEYAQLVEDKGHLPWAKLEPLITELYHEYSHDIGPINEQEQIAATSGSERQSIEGNDAGTESPVARLEGPRQEATVERTTEPVSKKKRRVAEEVNDILPTPNDKGVGDVDQRAAGSVPSSVSVSYRSAEGRQSVVPNAGESAGERANGTDGRADGATGRGSNEVVTPSVVRSRVDDAKTALAEAVGKWKGVVADYVSGALNTRSLVTMFESTPASMQALGLPNLPVRGSVSHTLAAIDQHGLSVTQMERIPGELADPVLVYASKNDNRPWSLNFVTRLRNADGIVVVAVHPVQDKPGGKTHYVATMFGRAITSINGDVRKGGLVYQSTELADTTKEAVKDAQKKYGRSAIDREALIANGYSQNLPRSAKVVYKSDLVKLIDNGSALYRRETLVFTDSTGQTFNEEVEWLDEANYPDVTDALDAVEDGPLAKVLDNVEGFYVTEAQDAYAYKNTDGSFKVVLPKWLLAGNPNTLAVTINHELAHVADKADAVNGGVNSSGIVMGVMVQKAKALYARLPEGSALKKHLEYPFSAKYPESKSAKLQRVELYAQLAAAYLDPAMAAELKSTSPALYNFAETIVNEIQEQHAVEKASQPAGVRDAGIASTGASAALRRRSDAAQQTRDQFGKTGTQVMDDARDVVSRGFKWFMSLHDLVSEYKAQLPSASSWYDSVRATIATRNKMESDAEAIAARAGKLKSEHLTQLNKFLAQSTLDQKWGYDATFTRSDGTKHVVKADPQMAQAFNRLPVEVQSLVKDIFAHGEKMKDTKYTTMRELGIKDPVLQAGALTGPYAPLKRFGDHIVVLKSKELVAAEKANDQKKVDELKKDGKHYVVSSFDTKGQAKAFERENAAKYESAVTFKGSEKLDLGHQMNTQTLQKLQASLKLEKIDKRAKEQFENLLKDMYLRAFDEHSARMSGLKRMNRAGFNEDMVRSFLSHARAEAGFLANMKHGAKTNEEYYKIEQEAKKDQYAGQDAFNAITQHYVANLEHKDTPIQDRFLALTTFQQLATNPAYHIQNLLQPVMVSVPRLAADFNNYAGAWTALRQGYAIVRKAVSGGLINDAKIDLSKVENQKLRDMLQAASDAGLLDVGMDEDLTKFESTKTGYGAVDKTSALMKKVVHKMRQTARRVEATNRISTAVAAFNMSYTKEADEAKATAYAISVLQDTQGDFSKTDAPLIIKKLPKFVVQYRKFQLMMAAHYVKAFRDAFRSEDLETRAVGRRTLAISLGHAFMASGVMGLPLMNLVGLAFAASGDDDEPKDLERSLREWVGDADTANFLLHSPLYFMGLDAKLSQDKIFSILPYADWNITSKKGVTNMALGAMGPSWSNGAKMAEGLGSMAKGEYYDGLIGLLPSGLSNGVKAFEMANKGYTLKNGDVMVKPEDINEFGLLMDSMGLKSPGTRRMDWYKNQQWEVKQFYSDRTKEIEHRYADAVKSGDTEKLSELRQDWQDLQAGKDHLRYIFGDQHDELKRQPLSNLLKYPQTQAKRERKLQKSVPQEL